MIYGLGKSGLSAFKFLKGKSDISLYDDYQPDIKNACKNADLLILHTEWDEFKSLDFIKLMNKKKFILYDLRNLYAVDQMKKKKIKYFSIGRSAI